MLGDEADDDDLPRQFPARRPVTAAAGHRTDTSPRATAAGCDRRVRRIFAAETGNYFLLLGTTLFLVGFGLVMVLSSSAVSSFKSTDDRIHRIPQAGLVRHRGHPAHAPGLAAARGVLAEVGRARR